MIPLRVFVECHERQGIVHREVREVEPSVYLEMYLTQKLDPLSSPFKDTARIFQPGSRIFLVDDIGVMIKGVLKLDGMPDVHVGFWDRILAGRETMCYTVARIVAEDERASGVWTAIPKSSRATIAFARRMGFSSFQETEDSVALVLLFT